MADLMGLRMNLDCLTRDSSSKDRAIMMVVLLMLVQAGSSMTLCVYPTTNGETGDRTCPPGVDKLMREVMRQEVTCT